MARKHILVEVAYEKVVIISGEANGLGLELPKQLFARNYYVCIIDSDKKALNKVNEEFKNNCNIYCGDISDEEFIKETNNDISKKGIISSLINNAGESSFKMQNATNPSFN